MMKARLFFLNWIKPKRLFKNRLNKRLKIFHFKNQKG
jgi:hypothetical protein